MISVIVKDQGVAELLGRAQRTTVNPEPLLRAAGTTLLSITLGNFSAHGAGYRPSPWPPRRDGSPATLKRSGTLSSSFHLTVTPRAAILANPMPYAAIHQFGGLTRPHPILPRRRKVLAWTAPGGRRLPLGSPAWPIAPVVGREATATSPLRWWRET